jgi:hypothetical protein
MFPLHKIIHRYYILFQWKKSDSLPLADALETISRSPKMYDLSVNNIPWIEFPEA